MSSSSQERLIKKLKCLLLEVRKQIKYYCERDDQLVVVKLKQFKY